MFEQGPSGSMTTTDNRVGEGQGGVAATYYIDYRVLCRIPTFVWTVARTLQSAVPPSHSRQHGPSFHQPGLDPHILNNNSI